MANFLEYNPEQGYLLPPNVGQVLGEEHLCFFVHRAVEKLDLSEFERDYSEEGHPAYHPALDQTRYGTRYGRVQISGGAKQGNGKYEQVNNLKW